MTFPFPNSEYLFPIVGNNCVSCSYKAQNGVLFPLERGFMYLHKVSMHMRRLSKFDRADFSPRFTRGLTRLTTWILRAKVQNCAVLNFTSRRSTGRSKCSERLTVPSMRSCSTLSKSTDSKFATLKAKTDTIEIWIRAKKVSHPRTVIYSIRPTHGR